MTKLLVLKDVDVLILLQLCTILNLYQKILEVMKNLLVLSMTPLGTIISNVLDLVLKEVLKLIVNVLPKTLKYKKLHGINIVIVKHGKISIMMLKKMPVFMLIPTHLLLSV
jgi:hypothetical protein